MGVFEDVMAGLGLVPRPQQQRLVSVARETLREGQRFVQAGTGTGKSFAVLSVALEAAHENGLPSVVVCPNNTLIDQYVIKDAPSVGGVAGGRFAHIKGRGRYVCANSVALVMKAGGRYQYEELTKGGELEWSKLGLDETYGCPGADTCNPRDDCRCNAVITGGSCVCKPVCGAFQAKKLAAMADVIITNAHVLMWDYLVRLYTGGFASLLPDYAALFVDECHELESVGRSCLSDEIKSTNPVVAMVPGLSDWLVTRAKHMLEEGLREEALERSVAIQKMAADARTMADEIMEEWGGQPPKMQQKQIKRLQRFSDFVGESDNFVSVIEVSGTPEEPGPATLKRVCVNASYEFSQILGEQPSLLVSGTIPGSDRRRLGLAKAKIEDVGHPFDYSKSTLIVSRFDAKASNQVAKRIDSATRAINQLGGGTLLLFTSWADLETITPLIAEGLKPGIDVYAQSREEPATLPEDVQAFRENGNAVLAGVRSLFTGLDIPGPALRQVILWKLPYQVPTIEVKAISELFGHSVYRDQMTMTLVQAIGRLIRSTEDRGRVIIMDQRARKLQWSTDRMAYHLSEFSEV